VLGAAPIPKIKLFVILKYRTCPIKSTPKINKVLPNKFHPIDFVSLTKQFCPIKDCKSYQTSFTPVKLAKDCPVKVRRNKQLYPI